MKPSAKWGQVPYAEFPNGKIVAQTKALARYFGKLSSLESSMPGEKLLYPRDEFSALVVDEFIEVCEDIRMKLTPTFTIQEQSEKEAARAALFAPGGACAELFVKLEANVGAYAAGDYMTLADVWAFWMMSFLRSGFWDGLPASCLDRYPKLNAICSRVKSHPAVCSYYSKQDGKLYGSFRRAEDKPIEVGYWAIRGLGAPLRMMCEYASVNYEDKQYASGQEWFGAEKERVLALNPLANLPYVIIGDKCICQSNTCMTFLGDRFGLNGSTAQEQIDCRQLLDEIYDLRNSMIDLAYPFRKVNRTKEEYEASARLQVSERCPAAYKKLEGWLSHKNTPFFVCDRICTADFHIFEMIDQHEKLAASCKEASALSKFPKLKAFHENMMANPRLEAYFASDAHKLPCNNPIANAYFG
eukprot:CAMPEP_0197642626 /NCGR_PEP_ID=MMETSP1338-20131121/16229_1 /TAXON_ID=43686 ORGANISM="Pelagodinium beii, Strain RCC1491" /NCGR_SAMPLE_ID=MMETSP1338 /ASSEMBLY_ACC=CAM_ASM_000754 /LENGTH=413 /DNA_ID=CAMNT_0043215769 /DNA_START=86 /DNA_END=1327 /DNA_ORIENTATION=+